MPTVDCTFYMPHKGKAYLQRHMWRDKGVERRSFRPAKERLEQMVRPTKNVRVPRSIAREAGQVKAIYLHVFADTSNIACSAVTIAVIQGATGVFKGLLTSKSRVLKYKTSIVMLELVSGRMAVSMVWNLHNTMKRCPIVSTTVWMDSIVALYWICNPGKT